MNNPYSKYQKTQVTTASKGKILLMLYEGAIRFIKKAKVAMGEKQIAEKGKYISKTTAILSELMATLDFKAGGKLAADLENLYVFMIDKLIEANINNDVKCLDVVENLLVTLYTAWKDVVENPRADGVPSERLQPDEYKAWMEKNQGKDVSQNEAGKATEDSKSKLKLMA
jgi:flagellar secretion chaperone FliS